MAGAPVAGLFGLGVTSAVAAVVSDSSLSVSAVKETRPLIMLLW